MIVVKIGGSEGVDLDAVCDDVARCVRDRMLIVLVHGGSHETNVMARTLGHEPEFLQSPSGYTSRRTDARTLEIFTMVCCGLVNSRIVGRLQRRGVRAVGLAGIDGPIWEGPRKSAIRAVENNRTRVVRDDYTGTVERVDAGLLERLMECGLLPVLSPPALSYDRDAINVDGDRAAAATAVALGATDLVILTNVAGLLRDPGDPATRMDRVAREDLDEASAFARGRMRTKLLGAREALNGGIRRVVLGDARVDRPLSRALAGEGTVIE